MRSAVFRPRGRLRPRRHLEGEPVEGKKENHAPYFLAALVALLILLPVLLLWGPGRSSTVIIESEGGEIGSLQPQPEQSVSAVRYVVVPSEGSTVPTDAILTGVGGQQQQQQGVVIVLP